MKLNLQKKLAAQMLKCGVNRVKFDETRLTDIKEAIKKTDIRTLIKEGAISEKRLLNTSGFWSRKRKLQKSKGKQKGQGSRKGKKTARTNPKRAWMNKIRLQRSYIKTLKNKELITIESYHQLYAKSKGGFFRSLRHLKMYVQEHSITKKV